MQYEEGNVYVVIMGKKFLNIGTTRLNDHANKIFNEFMGRYLVNNSLKDNK